MIRIAWTELRRSTLFWAAPLVLAVQLMGMLMAAGDDWSDSWSTASLAVAWPGFIVAAVLGGTTAMAAVSRSRRGESILANAARPRWELETALLLPPLAVSVVTVGLGIVTALLKTWPAAHTGAGGLRLGFPLLAWSLMLLAIGLGHLAGRWVPSTWTAPVVAVLVLGVAVTTSSRSGLVFVPLLAPIQLSLNPVAVLAPLAAGAALVLVGAAGVRARQHAGGRPHLHLPTALAGALTCIALLVTTTGVPQLVPRTDDPVPVCTEGDPPTVCLYPEAPVMHQAAQLMVERISSLPDGRLTSPEVIYQNGLVAPGEPGVSIDGGSWFLADGVASTILVSSGLTCAYESADDPDTAWAAYSAISEWLTSRIYGEPRPATVHTTVDGLLDLPAVHAVLRQSEGRQGAWLDQQVTTLRSACGDA